MSTIFIILILITAYYLYAVIKNHTFLIGKKSAKILSFNFNRNKNEIKNAIFELTKNKGLDTIFVDDISGQIILERKPDWRDFGFFVNIYVSEQATYTVVEIEIETKMLISFGGSYLSNNFLKEFQNLIQIELSKNDATKMTQQKQQPTLNNSSFCTKCGNSLKVNEKFCTKCGATINENNV